MTNKNKTVKQLLNKLNSLLPLASGGKSSDYHTDYEDVGVSCGTTLDGSSCSVYIRQSCPWVWLGWVLSSKSTKI